MRKKRTDKERMDFLSKNPQDLYYSNGEWVCARYPGNWDAVTPRSAIDKAMDYAELNKAKRKPSASGKEGRSNAE